MKVINVGAGSGGIPPTIFDAKGDLIVASAPDVAGRLAAGADGLFLQTDAASPLGVRWTALPGGAILASIVDAKGDLIVGSAPDAVSRLAAGADGQFLQADSAAGLGVKWAALAAAAPNVLVSKVPNADTRNANSYAAIATAGPSVNLLAAKNYLVAFGALINCPAGGEIGRMSIDIGGAAAVDADAASHQVPTGASPGQTSVATAMLLTAPGAITLTAKYKSVSAGIITFSNRFLVALEVA